MTLSSRHKLNSFYIHYRNPHCLWLPNLTGCGYIIRSSFHKATRPFEPVVLLGQSKNSICYFSTTTRPMTDKLGKETSNHKLIQPFELVVLQGHDTLKQYISIITMPMAIKSRMVVLYSDELPSMKLWDSLIAWSCKIWQNKYVTFPLPQPLLP